MFYDAQLRSERTLQQAGPIRGDQTEGRGNSRHCVVGDLPSAMHGYSDCTGHRDRRISITSCVALHVIDQPCRGHTWRIL